MDTCKECKMKDKCIHCKAIKYSIKPPLKINAMAFCRKHNQWIEIPPEFKINRDKKER